jgi:hypothetical protein
MLPMPAARTQDTLREFDAAVNFQKYFRSHAFTVLCQCSGRSGYAKIHGAASLGRTLITGGSVLVVNTEEL